MSTFYIDKDDGGHEMFRDTREIKKTERRQQCVKIES